MSKLSKEAEALLKTETFRANKCNLDLKHCISSRVSFLTKQQNEEDSRVDKLIAQGVPVNHQKRYNTAIGIAKEVMEYLSNGKKNTTAKV